MTLSWRVYQSDTNQKYGYVPVDLKQLNDRESTFDFLVLYPLFVTSNLAEIKYPCRLKTTTPRQVRLTLNDGGVWVHTYSYPYFDMIRAYLSTSPDISEFQFKGERIRHTALRQTL